MNVWITREEACELLGVKPQTLYAYVSRGVIEVTIHPENPRQNVYRSDDIYVLLEKRGLGRGRKKIAASTMFWGEPIINTRLSHIFHGRLYYKGFDAIQLSDTTTLEDIAKLLWQTPTTPFFPYIAPISQHSSGRARAYAALGSYDEVTFASKSSPKNNQANDPATLLGLLASAFVPISDTHDPIHLRIARAWHCEEKADLIRRTLVLLADQELSTSAFAARVTASTGATLAACALTGLSTLSGPLHGSAIIHVQALLNEIKNAGIKEATKMWVQSSHQLPGFGHRLYPFGDPRAAELLSRLKISDDIQNLIDYMLKVNGEKPTIDIALAAMIDYCHLPQDAAFSLFAIGRMVGWMAHSLEQIHTGTLLRPRANYVGPLPETHTSEKIPSAE